jgi:lipoate-protein ligase A
MNMALEEAIPISVGNFGSPNTVRFWRNQNAVVIGNFQSAEMEVNLTECKKHQTTLVRRFTGGGAVYQDLGNLNCAISLSKHHWLVKSDFAETFSRLSNGLAKGLRLLGVEAHYEPPNSLEVNGRKIVGSACVIRSKFVFQHSSILINSDLQKLSMLLEFNSTVTRLAVRSVRKKVSNLAAELGRELTMDEVKRSLIKSFEKEFAVKLAESRVTEKEKTLAEKLRIEKYSKDTWNFKL